MTDVLVTPAFLPSDSLDTGDTSKLGPKAWKASRLFTGGGNARDLCMRDGAASTGASWVAPSVAVTKADLGLRGAAGTVLVGLGVGVDPAFSASPTLTSVLVGDGSAGAPSLTFASDLDTGIFRTGANAFVFTNGGTSWQKFDGNLSMEPTSVFGWTSGDPTVTGRDTILARDAANVLALKNGTNAQAFRVYGNATGSKYLSLAHNGTDAILTSTAGNILLTGATTGFGYGTGAGGAVTQATSKSQGVTLNTVTGQITMNGAALLAAAKVSFVVTDSAVAATDTIIVSIASGGTANAYRANVTAVAAGSFTVTVENITAGSLSEAPIVNFAVIKGVAS